MYTPSSELYGLEHICTINQTDIIRIIIEEFKKGNYYYIDLFLNISAMYGHMEEFSGIKREIIRAKKLAQFIISQGEQKSSFHTWQYSDALTFLGLIALKEVDFENSCRKTYLAAKNFFLRAVAYKNTTAMSILASMYLFEDGADKNLPYAIELLDEAVLLNDPFAMVLRVYAYSDEIKSSQEPEPLIITAKKLLSSAAKAKFPSAVNLSFSNILPYSEAEYLQSEQDLESIIDELMNSSGYTDLIGMRALLYLRAGNFEAAEPYLKMSLHLGSKMSLMNRILLAQRGIVDHQGLPLHTMLVLSQTMLSPKGVVSEECRHEFSFIYNALVSHIKNEMDIKEIKDVGPSFAEKLLSNLFNFLLLPDAKLTDEVITIFKEHSQDLILNKIKVSDLSLQDLDALCVDTHPIALTLNDSNYTKLLQYVDEVKTSVQTIKEILYESSKPRRHLTRHSIFSNLDVMNKIVESAYGSHVTLYETTEEDISSRHLM